ncbi:hypothetical protein BS78_05G037500 [Paspalum vaginatum]|nr:hypothetical protein BS78_05G037500 [Paspalum vaginatum]
MLCGMFVGELKFEVEGSNASLHLLLLTPIHVKKKVCCFLSLLIWLTNHSSPVSRISFRSNSTCCSPPQAHSCIEAVFSTNCVFSTSVIYHMMLCKHLIYVMSCSY